MKNNESKPAALQGGFVKMMRTPDILELLETSPLAFALAAVIALRARYQPGVSLKGLLPGEAFIGDHEKYGMSRQQYRTAIGFLKKHGFAAFKSTTKGTRAKLMDTRLFKVLNEAEQPTRQPSANHQPTTNKKGKKEKKGKKRQGHANSSQAPASRSANFNQPIPLTADEVFEFGRGNGCDWQECARFIRYNNSLGWKIGAWKPALIGFRDTCETSPGNNVGEVPHNWIPQIELPDDYVDERENLTTTTV